MQGATDSHKESSGMLRTMRYGRSAKIAVALCAALALGACAKKSGADGLDGAGGYGSGRGGPPGSTQDFVVNVGDRVFFETDSTELTSTARSTLDKQASWLSRYPRYKILVEGHADERGTREYNFALGARRSQVTRDYLAARGVSVGRMRTTSYGKERPVAVCDDISCWSQNRRAVTVLSGGAGS
jgi:peptidoglycan-associated lipoprotein